MGTVSNIRPGKTAPPADPNQEQVRLLACGRCNTENFKLVTDGRVVCANCLHPVLPLRWWDVNTKPPAA